MPATASNPAAGQTEFEFLLNDPEELLRVEAVAQMIGYDKETVYRLINEGHLEAFKNQRTGTNTSYRVTRRSVLARLANTALFAPADFLTVACKVCSKLSPAQRRELVQLLLSMPR